MRTVRIYKDNIREHIFRSLFFSDVVLCVGGGILVFLVVSLSLRLLFSVKDTGILAMGVITLEVFYIVFITLRLEKQPLYQLIPRAVSYQLKKKQLLPEELETTLTSLTIDTEYLIAHKELLAVYEITPFDIALLNDEEQTRFYEQLKGLLHSLPGTVQFIAQKRRVKESDFTPHFYSLYKNADPKKDVLLSRYVADMKQLVTSSQIVTMAYFVVLAASLPKKDTTHFQKAAKTLFEKETRLRVSLSQGRITLTKVKGDDLERFCSSVVGGEV